MSIIFRVKTWRDWIHFVWLLLGGSFRWRPTQQCINAIKETPHCTGAEVVWKGHSGAQLIITRTKRNIKHGMICIQTPTVAQSWAHSHFCRCASPCRVSLISGLSFLIRPVWCFSSEWRRPTSEHRALYVCCMLFSLHNKQSISLKCKFPQSWC